ANCTFGIIQKSLISFSNYPAYLTLMNKLLIFLFVGTVIYGLANPSRLQAASDTLNWIVSGTPWSDTDGNIIEAHSGGMLKVGDNYYWYGENHRLGLGNQIGIS